MSERNRNPLWRLYHWVLGLAESPYGVLALFLIAVAESSFFPIPPDVLLLALALGTPAASYRFAAWCTLGSVIGGVIGYAIGVLAWTAVKPMMIPAIFSEAKFEQVTGLYDEWGVLIVFVAAFTPIPYKVFTIAAGVFGLNLPAFIAASAVGRGARFFLVAAAVRRWGDDAKVFIEHHFNKLTLVFGVILIAGFALLKLH